MATLSVLMLPVAVSAAGLTPDPFTFTDTTDAARSTLVESNTVTVSGIDAAVPVAITLCTGIGSSCRYSINGAPYTAMPGQVVNGDTVKVRQASSGSHLVRTDLTLRIGEASDTFSVTTVPNRGDVDGNGLINLQDAIRSAQVLAGLPAPEVHAGSDVDGDGRIGQPELLFLLRNVAGLGQGETGAELALDENGTVQSTVAVTNPGGTELTLAAGTRIAFLDGAGDIEPPAALENVRLAIVEETAALPGLPAGIDLLTRFRIVLTVDGIERDAWFWPGSAGNPEETGLKLVYSVAGQEVDYGILGLLFDAASGGAVKVGSSTFKAIGEAAPVAGASSLPGVSAAASTAAQMNFSPNHTGSYMVGGSASGSGTAPGGAFWSSVSVPDPGCIPVGDTQVCGPSKVDRVEIIEESTAEILGMCSFGAGNTASTGVLPPGYQFWCTRTQSSAGGATEIKVSSMQANLPMIHAYLVRMIDNLPMWESYHQAGVLNGPGGAGYADPYQNKEFEFAGFKPLTFKSGDIKSMKYYQEHALQPLQEAGYEAVQKRYEASSSGSSYLVDVYDTLDGRGLMQDEVILKEDWKVITGEETRGNKGSYKVKRPSYKGTFTATSTMSIVPWTGHGEVTWTPGAEYGEYGEYDVVGTITPDQTQYIFGDTVCTLNQPEQPIDNLGQIKDFAEPARTYWAFQANWTAICTSGGTSMPIPNFISIVWGSSCGEEEWYPLDDSYPEHLRGSFTWTGCPAAPNPILTSTVSWDFIKLK